MAERLLHRQIHPNLVVNDFVSHQAFIETGIIASGAFLPKQNDKDKLSVYNGEVYDAKASFDHYTKQNSSYGVLSVTDQEVLSIDQLSVNDDNDPFHGHSCIDFSQVDSKNQKQKKAGILRDMAKQRGWSFRP